MRPPRAAGLPARVEWLGQGCVTVTCEGGARVLFDPYESGGFDGRIAYAPPQGDFDAVALTHHHADHAHVTPLLGAPRVVDRSRRVGDLRFVAVPAYHDTERGARMGLVRLLSLRVGGANIVHLGDVGVPPSPGQARRLGTVDVALVPVGGTFTLDAEGAVETIRRLRPRFAVPIHYATQDCTLPIEGVTPFLVRARAAGWPVENPEDGGLTLHGGERPETTHVVLLPARCLAHSHSVKGS